MLVFMCFSALMLVIFALFLIVPLIFYCKKVTCDSSPNSFVCDTNIKVSANSGKMGDYISLRAFLRLPLLIVFVSCFLAVKLYDYLGATDELRVVLAMQENLDKPQDIENIVGLLKRSIQKRPSEVSAVYLLYEIEMAKENYTEAAALLGQIVKMRPEDVDMLLLYAQALYLADGNYENDMIDELIDKVLLLSPENPQALGFKALILFGKKQYQASIDIWQRMLELYSDLNNAEVVRMMIQKAKDVQNEPENATER